MKKRLLILAAVIVAVGLASPARAFFGPLPVIDVQGEGTWLRQLAQELAQGESLKSILASAQQELTPTPFGWPLGSHGPLQAQPILQAAEAQIAAAATQIQANTGAPPAPDQATILAQQGVAQIPADTADIDAAKVASDNADGNLSAQQVQHRFDAIALKQQQSALNLAYVQQLQNASDDATLAAYFTSPSVISTGGSVIPTADEVRQAAP
jgi:hypothetical protein